MSVVRFGVSLRKELLEELDAYMLDNQLTNRSQAIRQLLNNNIVINKWKCNNVVAGSLTLVYNQNKKGIVDLLSHIQHEYRDIILSSQHFFLDDDTTMEIIALKGKAVILTKFADKIKSVKGLHHGALAMSKA